MTCSYHEMFPPTSPAWRQAPAEATVAAIRAGILDGRDHLWPQIATLAGNRTLETGARVEMALEVLAACSVPSVLRDLVMKMRHSGSRRPCRPAGGPRCRRRAASLRALPPRGAVGGFPQHGQNKDPRRAAKRPVEWFVRHPSGEGRATSRGVEATTCRGNNLYRSSRTGTGESIATCMLIVGQRPAVCCRLRDRSAMRSIELSAA